MARGGHRSGAGRPRGSKSKHTIAKLSAESPLDILLAAARDQNQPIELRLAAAKAAAPFLHRRPSSKPFKLSFEEAKRELEAAIAREQKPTLRTVPGPQIRVVK